MGRKILIVDDEPEIVRVMQARLEHVGYDVRTASGGKEALEKFKAEKPDLIITDVMMPEMTGYEFFEMLRKLDGGGASVPVVVISARGSMGQFFDKWAIAAFIPKPFNMPFFVEEIQKILAPHAPVHEVDRSVAAQKKDGRRMILLVGVSEFELRKMTDFLEENFCNVVPGLNEKDAFEVAKKLKPDFILMEFWEDPARFDTVSLFHSLAADPATKPIPYSVFCRGPLYNDVLKNFYEKYVLRYDDVAELTRGLESLMQTPRFKKRSY